MAREKRPAETTTTSHSKRQKILNIGGSASSPDNRDEIGPNVDPEEVLEDDERLTQDIQSKLDKLKSDHAKRNKASKAFEERIRKEQERLSCTIESATDKIEGNRDNFRSRMLPVLDSALKDLSLQPEMSPQEGEVSTINPKLEPVALQMADNTLRSCSQLIACYKRAKSIPLITSSTSSIKNTFETDKDETTRAFESAKKMTINQLQAALADKTEDTEDRYDLDEYDYHLARKVLLRGKRSSLAKVSTNLGSLLYDFGKIVGKMQNMVDG